MRAMMVGAALAAVMACGWASGAEASPVSISANLTSPDTQASVALDYDNKNSLIGSFSYSFYTDYVGNPSYQSYGIISDKSANISLSSISYIGDKTSDNYLAERTFTVKNPNFLWDIIYTQNGMNTVINKVGYSYEFTVDGSFEQGLGFSYVVSQNLPTPMSFYNGPGVSGNFFSPVPLPASASLFGIALAGFGILPLIRRRIKKQASSLM